MDHREDGSLRFLITSEQQEEDAPSRQQVTGLRHLSLQNEQARSADATQDLPPSTGEEHLQVSTLSVLRLRAATAAPAHSYPPSIHSTQWGRHIWNWQRVLLQEQRGSGDQGGHAVSLLGLSVRRTQEERHHLPPSVPSSSTLGALPLSRLSVLGRRQTLTVPASEGSPKSGGLPDPDADRAEFEEAT